MDVTQAFGSELDKSPNLELYVVLRLLGYDTGEDDGDDATPVAIHPVDYWAYLKSEKKILSLKQLRGASSQPTTPSQKQIDEALEFLRQLETGGLDKVLPKDSPVRVEVRFTPTEKKPPTLLVVDSLTEQPSKQK